MCLGIYTSKHRSSENDIQRNKIKLFSLGVQTGEAKGQTVRLLWSRQKRCLVDNKDTGIGRRGYLYNREKNIKFYVN